MPGPILPPTMSLIVRADPGDTLSTIAEQFGVTTQELRDLNPGLETIAPGTELSVPAKTVQARTEDGDTWESVAQQFSTTPEDLRTANPDITDLTPGQVITIP